MNVEFEKGANPLGLTFEEVEVGQAFYYKMVPEVICIKVKVEGNPYEYRYFNTSCNIVQKCCVPNDRICFPVQSKLVIIK